jgi:DNA-binding CsgD family transcriptional regulator
MMQIDQSGQSAQSPLYPINGGRQGGVIYAVILAVFILVFALFLVAGMLGRSFEPPLPSPFNLFSNAAIAGTYLAAVFYSRFRGIPTRRLLTAASMALALYLLIRYLPAFICQMAGQSAPQFPVVLLAMTNLIYGFASASFRLLMFLYLLRYGLRLFCCLLPIACALCEAFYLVSLLIPQPIAYWLSPLCLVTVLIIFPLLMRQVKPPPHAMTQTTKRTGSAPLSSFISIPERLGTRQNKSHMFLEDPQRLGLLVFGSLVFPLLYGFVAQICVLAHVSLGLYDVWSEVVAIIAYLLLGIIAAFVPHRLRVESGFTVILALFSMAFLILPIVWGEDIFLSGFMVKVGFLLYNTLVYLAIVRVVQREPHSFYFYFALAFALQLFAITGGRELGGLFFPMLELESVALASLVVIWLLAVCTLALSFLVRRQQPAIVDKTTSAFEQRCILFAQRYALSNREFEVLLAFTRGRSMNRIAEALSISNNTARTYIDRIYAKAGLRSKQELIAFIENLEEDE